MPADEPESPSEPRPLAAPRPAPLPPAEGSLTAQLRDLIIRYHEPKEQRTYSALDRIVGFPPGTISKFVRQPRSLGREKIDRIFVKLRVQLKPWHGPPVDEPESLSREARRDAESES